MDTRQLAAERAVATARELASKSRRRLQKAEAQSVSVDRIIAGMEVRV